MNILTHNMVEIDINNGTSDKSTVFNNIFYQIWQYLITQGAIRTKFRPQIFNIYRKGEKETNKN